MNCGRNSLFPYIAASVAVHVVILLLIASGLLAQIDWSPPVEDPPELTLVPIEAPAPQRPSQVITSQTPAETATPPEDTPFESDRNTTLRTETQGQTANSFLPNQNEGIASNALIQPGTPSSQQPAPASQNSPAPAPEPPVPPVSERPQPPQNVADTPPPPAEDAMPLLSTERRPTPVRDPVDSPSTQSPLNPRAPPVSQGFSRDKSKMDGGRGAIGPASAAARETPLGKYKSRLYQAIGSAWYIKVDQSMGLLAISSVKIKFYVQANGVIRDIKVVNKTDNSEMLETISIQSILKISPFVVFPDNLKQQLGPGFEDEVTFSIY
jgi:outer membrane biosynthesis protein TonB